MLNHLESRTWQGKWENGEVWGLDPVLVDPSRTFPSIREELELDEPWN